MKLWSLLISLNGQTFTVYECGREWGVIFSFFLSINKTFLHACCALTVHRVHGFVKVQKTIIKSTVFRFKLLYLFFVRYLFRPKLRTATICRAYKYISFRDTRGAIGFFKTHYPFNTRMRYYYTCTILFLVSLQES